MTRRGRPEGEGALSLDSFLDLVTNVVGVLILVAVVTVLGARDVADSAGASVLEAPPPSAARVLVECAGDRLFVVDEAVHARRILDEVQRRLGEGVPEAIAVVSVLHDHDVGDSDYRVLATEQEDGLAWIYERRKDASGTSTAELASGETPLHRALASLEPGGFIYFVVREDGFETFRQARAVAAARRVHVGWHPIEASAPLALSARGSLGRRVQ